MQATACSVVDVVDVAEHGADADAEPRGEVGASIAFKQMGQHQMGLLVDRQASSAGSRWLPLRRSWSVSVISTRLDNDIAEQGLLSGSRRRQAMHPELVRTSTVR